MNSDRPPAGVHVVLARSEPEFLALREEWNRLAARIPSPSVFLRHEWFEAAWQWARADSKLYIMALFDGAQLIGAIPLISRSAPGYPRLRKLSFLTVPDTQVCDILADPERRTEVLAALIKDLDGRRDWDVLELPFLASDTADQIQRAVRVRGRPAVVFDQGSNPGLELVGSWDQYYARRSRRLKKGNNLISNKLKKGGHAFQLKRYSSAELRNNEVLSRLLDEITTVSANSWKRETGLSLNFPGPAAFIRRLSERAAQQGWLSIWTFEVDGRMQAMEYQLQFGGCLHALRSDYDESVADLSPGTYLNWKMLEQLFQTSDGTRYLMGPGDNAYKLRWAERFDPVNRLVIYGPTALGRCRAFVDLYLRPAVRRIRNRLSVPKPFTKEAP